MGALLTDASAQSRGFGAHGALQAAPPVLTNADYERAEHAAAATAPRTFFDDLGTRLGVSRKENGSVELFDAGRISSGGPDLSGTIDRHGAHLDLRW